MLSNFSWFSNSLYLNITVIGTSPIKSSFTVICRRVSLVEKVFNIRDINEIIGTEVTRWSRMYWTYQSAQFLSRAATLIQDRINPSKFAGNRSWTKCRDQWHRVHSRENPRSRASWEWCSINGYIAADGKVDDKIPTGSVS